ncbi:tat (twin-arginine translocation) pathway signal sequence [Pseudomonas oligotrophica]|uniref:tat (twin-arginine translocation) pathway signal sequence n=1 Tax=Pseudomonas oligotrophica TaxID=2912055 RepID=UPI001F439D81|nr:tat (twin-arginine translocation) pathway signal sequence [Pseudomonas oligotrophica]MCF7201324.1 tat (twin-arginine translocation) pathway signal sequence [Pseudomonas oligotrophica]
MSEMTLNRRRFLQGAGSVLLGTLLFVNGPVALAAPTHSWSLPLTRLSGDQAERLLVMVRRLYPHDSMEDAVYALVVKELDSRAAADPGVAELLASGVATLDREAGGDWRTAEVKRQLAILGAMEGQPFFTQVRSVAVVALYSNELAYLHFGYEGASYPKGGYLHRGFNDLSWLPDPPVKASPKPFA